MISPQALARVTMPPTLLIGGGASRQVGEEARRLGLKRLLIVSDAFLVQAGVAGQVRDDLAASGLEAYLFADVQPDPTLANVDAGLRSLRDQGCDGLVAVGGGSSIDCAKAIAIAATNPQPLAHFMGYHKIPHAGLPLIAIPTTAGTGSEVSQVTVITDTDRQVKMMILDRHLMPTCALVDYELTLTMPGSLTAAVGLDSFTHALEAYVSRLANAFSDLAALEAGRLIARHIRTAFHQPMDRPAREGMMLGATLGGIAFSNASVALVHGMSRPIGAYFHVPHGLSNAMLLPTVTRYTVPSATSRYATFARHVGLAQAVDDQQACQELVNALVQLNRDLQVPSPRTYGIDPARFEEALPRMAEDALASGSPARNPRVPTAKEIISLYRECFNA